MTKREAKSHAWFRAGLILESTLNEGWPHEEEVKPGNHDKLAEALLKIVKYCYRQASRGNQ